MSVSDWTDRGDLAFGVSFVDVGRGFVGRGEGEARSTTGSMTPASMKEVISRSWDLAARMKSVSAAPSRDTTAKPISDRGAAGSGEASNSIATPAARAGLKAVEVAAPSLGTLTMESARGPRAIRTHAALAGKRHQALALNLQ